MRRRVLHTLVVVLYGLCGAASLAQAQEFRLLPSSTTDSPKSPQIDAPPPAEPPMLNAGPKGSELKNDAPPPAEPPMLDAAPKASGPKVDLQFSPNTALPRLDQPQEPKKITIVDLALQSSA